jgi:hypothetical protein
LLDISLLDLPQNFFDLLAYCLENFMASSSDKDILDISSPIIIVSEKMTI